MPFDETEDMLQYLFPSQLDWSILNPPSMGMDDIPHSLLNSNRIVADAEGVSAENSSPQALVQLDALIEDAVSTVHRDYLILSDNFLTNDNADTRLPVTEVKLDKKASPAPFSILVCHFSFLNSMLPSH